MTGKPSRAAPPDRNGPARVASPSRPARRQQQPAAGRRRRRPYRHLAELRPPRRHRRRRARDRRHRRRHGLAAPAGITGSGATRASSPVKNTRTSSARPANRRSHPRTVGAGRPSRPAIRRCPSPAAAATSAAPITSAASARRSRHHAGSSTCVAPHPRHRDLRGTSTTSVSSGPSAARTRRCRAFPHPPSTPPHDGHASSPAASCRSTSSPSPFTVSTTPPRVTQRPSPGFAKRSRGGPHHNRPAHRAAPSPRPQPRSREPRPRQSSARCRRRRTLTHQQAGTRRTRIFNAAEKPLTSDS